MTKFRRLGYLIGVASLVIGIAAVPETTSSAVTAPPCGGEVVAKSTGGTWVCTADDEFSGTGLATNFWTAMNTATDYFRGGQECNMPGDLHEASGVLTITATHTLAQDCGKFTTRYDSGGITSLGKFSQTYGRFEIRAKFPPGKGFQPAIWMLPANPQSTGKFKYGEIDIAETYGSKPGVVDTHVHYVQTPGTPGNGLGCTVPTEASAYNTYALEWTPTTLKFIYDGTTCWTTTWKPKSGYAGGEKAPAPFNQPFYLMIELAIGGSKTPNNTPNAKTVFPATMSVDYVRVWK